jgi:formylglycine-generating enzyme
MHREPVTKLPAQVEGMAWIPGGTFLMGSDRHYPEEAPAHKVAVGGSGWTPTPSPIASFSAS